MNCYLFFNLNNLCAYIFLFRKREISGWTTINTRDKHFSPYGSHSSSHLDEGAQVDTFVQLPEDEDEGPAEGGGASMALVWPVQVFMRRESQRHRAQVR